MVIAALIGGLVFAALGVLGGMTAFGRWVRGYSGYKLLDIRWAIPYVLGLLVSGSVVLGCTRTAFNDWEGLLVLALLPFGILGAVMWGFAFAMELFVRTTTPTASHIEPTYDVGDGLMVRQRYADAEAAFRQNLNADPADVNAFLRICKARQARGDIEIVLRDLNTAWRDAIDRTDSAATPPRPALLEKLKEKEYRQDRILRLTFALGDIYVERLNNNDMARKLYAATLEHLFGYPPADPLRDRLKALEKPDRLTIEEAAEESQPSRIPFPNDE
ncbi:MAG TPA: hypothetical protein VGP72_23870 [Planctomycetota bacterium]|jgi:tetratricopeptide (TPR) repeat protein